MAIVPSFYDQVHTIQDHLHGCEEFFSPKILASQKMASKKVVEDGEAKIHQSQICQISRCWNSPREIPGHRDGDGWKMGGGAVQKGDGCWYRILWV